MSLLVRSRVLGGGGVSVYDIIHKELMRGVSCKTHVNWVGNYRAI